MLRLDRLLTLGMAVLKPRRRALHHIPILMYHSIAPLPARSSHPYFEIRTPQETFRLQMKMLKELNRQPLSLEEQQGLFRTPPSDSRRQAVVVTFDDAYQDFYDTAFPVLQDFGIKATVFVPTGLTGRQDSRGMRYMTWQQIRELRRAGVLFGSHTVNHSVLNSLSPRALEGELKDSRKMLEDQLGEQVESFSHPFAFPTGDAAYLARFKAALRRCGYLYGVTTIVGVAKAGDDPACLCRLPINGYDDPLFFQAKLDGAYDWIRVPQTIYKTFRSAASPRFGNSFSAR